MRVIGRPPRRFEDPLITAIRSDNLSLFASYVPTFFSIDHKFSPFFVGADPLLRYSPPLVSVTAFYSSIECFRYLLVNGVNLHATDSAKASLAVFAVAGGNLEILALLDAQNISFSGTLFTAAERGNFSTFLWVFVTQLEPLKVRRARDGTLLHAAVKGKNWALFDWLAVALGNWLNVWEAHELRCAIANQTVDADDSAEEDSASW
jgi:hypothetical protein